MYLRPGRAKSNFSVLRRDKLRRGEITSQTVRAFVSRERVDPVAVARDFPPVNKSCEDDATTPKVQEPLKPITDAPELDETLYQQEALQLTGGLSEDVLDQKYLRDAMENGLVSPQDDPSGKRVSSVESTYTLASENPPSSNSSSGSHSTGLTSHQWSEVEADKSKAVSSSFVHYDRYLARAQAQAPERPLSSMSPPPIPSDSAEDAYPAEPAPSVFSVSSRRSYFNLKQGLRRFSTFRRPRLVIEEIKSCESCPPDFKRSEAVHSLPCCHGYCQICLHETITQATEDESRMPPKCCDRPVSAVIIQAVLDQDQQQHFVRTVIRFMTPWEERIYCPYPDCAAFVPRSEQSDPKQPSEVVCHACNKAICTQCKREAHASGVNCPVDGELDAARQNDEQRWTRCHQCRALMALTEDCTQMTCPCSARSCSCCGAIWHVKNGCPNACDGEQGIERRKIEAEKRREERQRIAAKRKALEVMLAIEAEEAAERTAKATELLELRKHQLEEMDRFRDFEQKQNWCMWSRHGEEKMKVTSRFVETEREMKERASKLRLQSMASLTRLQHAKTVATLEDRQVAAEMELREVLKQEQRSCSVRLRHMEAYCERVNSKSMAAGVTITERDLRELSQQYNLRDNMEQICLNRINVLRDMQAKQLEKLGEKQEQEREKLKTQSTAELASLDERFGLEDQGFETVFGQRKSRLSKRWTRGEEILRKKLEMRDGVSYGPLPKIKWYKPKEPEASMTPGAESWVLI